MNSVPIGPLTDDLAAVPSGLVYGDVLSADCKGIQDKI